MREKIIAIKLILNIKNIRKSVVELEGNIYRLKGNKIKKAHFKYWMFETDTLNLSFGDKKNTKKLEKIIKYKPKNIFRQFLESIKLWLK